MGYLLIERTTKIQEIEENLQSTSTAIKRIYNKIEPSYDQLLFPDAIEKEKIDRKKIFQKRHGPPKFL